MPLSPTADTQPGAEIRSGEHPQTGPRLLFFSGGSALRSLCAPLQRHTWRSIHLVTTLDSGGSSAALRAAFAMPAVGDLRNRLLALADPHEPAIVALSSLLDQRLSASGSAAQLRHQLTRLTSREHCRSSGLTAAAATCVHTQVRHVLQVAPASLDLREASIGNLVLTGLWLNHDHDLCRAVDALAQHLQVHGTVRPAMSGHWHLGAELTDGTRIIGQHRLTGKTQRPIQAPVHAIHLLTADSHWQPQQPPLDTGTAQLIAAADLICYPPGSFYSSVLANLLAVGTADAIAANPCRKVLVPNLGEDPEQFGMSLVDCLSALARVLRLDSDAPLTPWLDTLLLDEAHWRALADTEQAAIKARGIHVSAQPLANASTADTYSPPALAAALMRLSLRPSAQFSAKAHH